MPEQLREALLRTGEGPDRSREERGVDGYPTGRRMGRMTGKEARYIQEGIGDGGDDGGRWRGGS